MLSFTAGHPTAGSATPASRAASPLTAQRGGWNCGLRFSRKAANASCASGIIAAEDMSSTANA